MAGSAAPGVEGDRSEARGGAPVPWWRRAPYRVHVALLAVVLLVGLAASRPGVAYTSDEGVAVLQARLLAETGGWRYEPPLPEVDPDDVARPFPRGDKGELGVAPYAKHPAYPLVLLAADRLGGTVGMLLTSVAGTLVAAAVAGLLARRLGPGLDVPTLWLVGVGSPLLFDAYLVLAHTLAAAAAGAAALSALRALERPDRAARWWGAACGLALAAALLRTEGAFVGPALALGVAAVAWRRRAGWRPYLVPVAGLVAAAALAVVVDRLALRAIVGPPRPTGLVEAPVGLVAGRAQAFVATVLDAGYRDGGRGQPAVWLALVAVVAVGVLLRRRPPAGRAATVAAWVAVAACLVRLAAPPDLIPGLAAAFPLLVAGLVLVRAADLRGDAGTVLAVAGGAVALAVWLTEYARGGGIEWGGRYFAVALPLLAPLAVAGLARGASAVPAGPRRRALVVALALVPLLLSLVAVRAHRTTHERTEQLLAAVARAADQAGPSGGLDRPVVLSTARLLPQIAYRDFDDYVWVVPARRDLPPVAERLAATGVEEVVVVTSAIGDLLEGMPGWEVVTPPDESGVGIVRPSGGGGSPP